MATIAFEGLEVFGDDIFVDLGHDITIEKFSEVGEFMVGHRDSKPVKAMLLLEILDNEP